jgi:hypothetical protein
MSLEHRSRNPIRNISTKRQLQFAEWQREMARTFPGAQTAIRAELNGFIDRWLVTMRSQAIQNPQFCSSWIPGAEWDKQGSEVYLPIYETMMDLYQQNHEFAHKMAGWFFGLILMDVVRLRTDGWECWHEARNLDDSPEGLYYRPLNALAQAV